MLAEAEVLQKALSAQAPRGNLCLASATCKKTRLIAHNLPEHCVVGQHHGMHSFDRAVNANIMLSGAEEHWLSHPGVVGFQTGVISALIGGRAVNYAV